MILVAGKNNSLSRLYGHGHFNNCRILKVTEGKAALDFIVREKIDLIFIEERLKDMSGIDLLKTLKVMVPLTPIVFIAEKSTKEMILQVFRSGAKDFLEKPLKKKSFEACVKRVLFWDHPGIDSTLFFNNSKECVLKSTAHHLNFGEKKKSGLKENCVELKGMTSAKKVKKRDIKKEESVAPELTMSFLGKLRLVVNGKELENWSSRKGRSIFTYLVYNQKKRVHRDVLMDRYWGNAPFHSARNCLNVTIHGLRKLFAGIDPDNEYILYKDEHYYINPDIETFVDTEFFMKYWEAGSRIEREKGLEHAITSYEMALTSYKGDFMEEDPYDSWPSIERERLRDFYVRILEKLSRYYDKSGQYFVAIDYYKSILAKDDCREDVHRRLMKCYQRLGKRDLALKQYKRCEENLRIELEVEPTSETTELYLELKQEGLRRNVYAAA